MTSQTTSADLASMEAMNRSVRPMARVYMYRLNSPSAAALRPMTVPIWLQ